jgi:hypothetical protein
MQSMSFTPFVFPVRESIFTRKSVYFEFLNFCTFGVWGAAEIMSKQYRIKEMKLVQEDLTNQLVTLTTSWDTVEEKMIDLLDELKVAHGENIRAVNKRFNIWVNIKEQLSQDSIEANFESVMTLSELALGTIFFIGHWLANVGTLGRYGAHRNDALTSRMITLAKKKEQLQTSFELQKKEKFERLQRIINTFNTFVETKEENQKLHEQLKVVSNTPEGQAVLRAVVAENELETLQKQHVALQNDISALKVQNIAIEKEKETAKTQLAAKKQEVQELRDRMLNLGNQELQVRQERDRLQQEINKKEQEFARERVQKKKELADLQVKLNLANAQADRVQILQKEIDRFHAATKLQPEATKLQSQLGPILPKYIRRPEDHTIPGAIDVDKVRDTLTPEQIQYAEAYNQRYGDKYTASAIVEASFQYAFDTLIGMATTGDKIKLNDSEETAWSRGAFAVYRYMILDLIKGGKVVYDGCHGYKLSINDDVEMLPSQPESVMQYEKDLAGGGLRPQVIVHYKQRDDFTPDEETLHLREGVDAPAAKWILEQLSDDEKGYLFTHLMDPVIENQHPDYQKMLAFMQDTNNPRVRLVLTVFALIQDMATALDRKFRSTLVRCWRANADKDIAPFVKVDVAPNQEDHQFIDWELDPDVIGDKGIEDMQFRQAEFYSLLVEAQRKHSILFKHINKGMLLHPKTNQTSIGNVTFDIVNKQYYCCHQMIGDDQYGKGNGQKCLFSNLLAVLLTDKADLTIENVYKLRKAMAAYLDKLQQAEILWDAEKRKPAHLQSKDAAKLKELAQLAEDFEKDIRRTHSCSIYNYQWWLRGEKAAANINISSLTPLEIRLAADTLRVRIGLLSINLSCAAIVDDCGRILPDGEFYGPNTKEFFLMGSNGGTYYGLSLRLVLDKNKLGDAYKDLSELEKYWKEIAIA